MTDTKQKLRGLMLSILMVTSVFAGTIAIAGTATAANTATSTDVEATAGPIEYQVPSGDILIDVIFSEEIQNANSETIEIIDKNENIIQGTTIANGVTGNSESLRINLGNAASNSAVDLSGDAVLRMNSIGTDDEKKNFSITTTSATVVDETGNADAAISNSDAPANAVAYQGSTVAIVSDDDDYEIFSDGDFVRSGGVVSNMIVATESTDDLATGTYNFSHGTDPSFETDGSDAQSILTLRDLGLTATADSTSLNRVDDGTATLEAEISSTVQGRSITAELINSSGEVEQTDSTLTIGGDRTVDASFTVDADDTYTIRATDDNTNITAETDDIVVSEVTGTASFTQSVFTEQRGDIAEFTVNLDNVEKGTVKIGSAAGQSDIGYGATAKVNDTDGDGEVTIELNTFAPNAANSPITVAGDDDELIESVSTTGTANPLDSGAYDLNVSVNSEEQDVATLSLTALSADAFTVLTGPPESDITSADATSDFDAFEAAGNLTAASSIASGDVVVHKIEASGLGGAIAALSDSSDSDEQAFADLLNSSNARLNITQTDASADANRDPKKLLELIPDDGSAASNVQLSGVGNYGAISDVNVVLDSTNDTYYFNFPIARGDATEDDRTVSDGDEFIANLTLVEGDLFDDDVSVTQTFTVNNRSVELDETGEDADGDDIITVEAATGQTVTGETNLAPGSEIEVRARATGADPFLLSQTVDTDSSGDFSATFDMSSIEVGTNFTFTAESANGGKAELDGNLVEQVTETPEPTETPAPTEEPTATPTEEPTATPTDEPTATETPGQPGFGVIVALLAFMAAALLAIRRD